MSIIATSISYFVSITSVSKTLSIAAAVLLTYYKSIHNICMLPLAQVMDFTLPSFFSVKNIKELIAF